MKLAMITFFIFLLHCAPAQELIRKENLGQTIQAIIEKNELNINWNYVDAVYPGKSNTIKKGYCNIRGFYSFLTDSSLLYFKVGEYADKKRNRYKNIFWKKVTGITIMDKRGSCRTIGLAPKKISIPKY